MRVGEIICRSENVPYKNLPSSFHSIEPFIRSSSHSIVGSGDFRQTVIAAPSTACTRRAKKQESSQSNCIQSCRTKTLGRIRGQMLSKIGHLQPSIVKLEKTASPIEHFESGVASSR
jgi:hypothetical protein